ncbi:hypothetical protein VPBG_00213 [Vibrio phage helene 12B3]|uniref:hypothetical protein n=1 Tax=Vibrio phage helene 12B3 TaxID=573173 RepID=UPI0002C0F95F|nr:hypothetical protein VPBG_00213 [Vibrio phage helene 12B3]AGG57985.1 hypothetical protein VPBG_00213 [Vibrio phage helene 12B3]
MINTNISFDKAVETVEHYTTPYPKGKNKGKYPLEVSETGFTCFANNLEVIKVCASIGSTSVPSKAEKAEELLKKVDEVYK